MNYWLMKADPETDWSWDEQVADDVTYWDGVRNAQAQNNMKAMRLGDKAFFYHSQKEKRIVGIVEIVKEFYPDHTDASGRYGMVDIKTVGPLANPVTLRQIKEDERLGHLSLVRQSRLSVSAIDAQAWKIICTLGGVSA